MARYYADNGLPRSNPGYQFTGWDDLGGEVVEATRADHLGRIMPESMRKAFQKMQPGTSIRTRTGNLERHD